MTGRAYSNAINAQQAQIFIEEAMSCMLTPAALALSRRSEEEA